MPAPALLLIAVSALPIIGCTPLHGYAAQPEVHTEDTQSTADSNIKASAWQHASLQPCVQLQAQKDHIAEQNQRCRDLEASTRQLEERCLELKESAAGHELRAKEAAAEVLKGNRIIEKVSVCCLLRISQ